MKKKIFLIDDEPDFTDLTSKFLNFRNFDVDVCNFSSKAYEIIRKNKYDLIITDLMMPGLDGFQIINMLRNDADYSHIPIIVLSVKRLSDEERKILIQNKVSFLVKPFEPGGLVDHIFKTLDIAQHSLIYSNQREQVSA